MKKRILSICIAATAIAAFFSTSYAQSKYGKITMEEMNMTSTPIDPTASAVVLMKDGSTEFKYDDLKGYFHEYTYRAKIKILKDDGLEYCEHSVFYYEGKNISSREEVRGLTGTTYNLEDGKITRTKLSKEFIVTEEHDEQNKRIKFSMPGAKVGSVIEFKYTLVSPFNYNIRDFDFQSYIPVEYAYYEIIIPEYFRYNMSMQGYEKIIAKEEGININIHMRLLDEFDRPFNYTDNCSGTKRMLTGENLPAMKEEPFLWSRSDYISRVNFELKSFQPKYGMVRQFSSKWNDIDKILFDYPNFGGNLKKTGLFKDDPQPANKDLAAAATIISKIRSKVKWNEKSEMFPNNLAKVLKEGLGSSADMNFLAINALNTAKFDAFPIILSTRSNGRIPLTHPSITAFNYSILGVMIDNKLYCIDVSDRFSTWNILPDKAMVTQGRILKSIEDARWVDLTKSSKGINYAMISYNFNKDGEYEGNINWTSRGKSAYAFRKYFYDKHKDEQDYIDKLSKEIAMPVENFKLENAENIGEEVKYSFSVKSDNKLGGEFIYIDPITVKHYAENPFKTEERKFPIQFDFCQDFIQVVNIAIPEGYQLEELPQSIIYTLDEENSIKFSYHATVSDRLINVKYHYTQNELLILQTKYPELKEFFSKIIAKCSEMIVLKKVSEEQSV